MTVVNTYIGKLFHMKKDCRRKNQILSKNDRCICALIYNDGFNHISAGVCTSIIYSNTLYFKGIQRRYHGVKG